MDKHPAPVKDSTQMRPRAGWTRRLGRHVLDQFYPPVCLNCEEAVATPDSLCARCWHGLRPITRPMCPVLGLPFEVPLGPDARSAEVEADPPPFERARSAVIYNDMAQRLVSRMKYSDKPELARFCARIMATACAEILDDAPVLVPVPLYRWRQWRRRYNQATELCRAVARRTGCEMIAGRVTRRRPTRQQVGLSAEQRARNVAGAFAVDPEFAGATGGRRVVLVDDVITTGATVKALTRELRRAGVDQIDVISFARVVIGPDMPI